MCVTLYLCTMSYSGKFNPVNTDKYNGDHTKIVYRSLWERKCMEWFDMNPDVVSWNSEEIVIPYRCRTDGELHRYYPDFLVKFRSGTIVLIEVKPEHQTVPPKKTNNKKRLINEAMTYAKNVSKWQEAESYCKKRGYVFMIWTERTLNQMGIKTNLYSGKK